MEALYEQVIRKYILENKDVRDIGKEVGKSRQTIVNILKKFRLNRMRQVIERDLDKSEKRKLIYDYIVLQRPISKIARELGRNDAVLCRVLRELFNIQDVGLIRRWHDYNLIASLAKKGYSILNVAYVFGISSGYVAWVLKKLDMHRNNKLYAKVYNNLLSYARKIIRRGVKSYEAIRTLLRVYDKSAPVFLITDVLLTCERLGLVSFGLRERILKSVGRLLFVSEDTKSNGNRASACTTVGSNR
jgi:hypothetical protein